MKRRYLILSIFTFFICMGYNACELPTQMLLRKTQITVTGNPMTSLPSMKIVNQACGVIMKAHPGLALADCQNGVLQTSFSTTLGVPSGTLNPYRTLAAAEGAGAVTATPYSLELCLSDIGNLDPNTAQVQSAFNAAAFDSFEGVSSMIPSNLGGCPQVYSGNIFPGPSPTPTPKPGSIIVNFDVPLPPGNPYNDIDGLYQGIDFGNQWRWEPPYYADTTNHIFMDTSNAPGGMASFAFSGGAKILDSVSAFASKQGGTLTLSDDTGQSVSLFIPADVSMHLVNTGFVNPSNIIMVNFSVPNALGLDEITFRAPVNPPPISFTQGTWGFATAPSNSVSFLSKTTQGNLIVAAAQWGYGHKISSIGDSQGNRYHAALPMGVSPEGDEQQIWYAENIKGGPVTVTIDFVDDGAPNYNGLYLYEYSGADPISPLDATSTVSGSGTSVNCGSVATQFPSEILFVGRLSESDTRIGQSPGFTPRAFVNGGENPFEDRILSSAGIYGATATATSTRSSGPGWVCQLVSFKSR